MRIAEYLDRSPRVRQVPYPGLPGHPGHEVAKRQMRGLFGGLLAFRLADKESAASFMGRLELAKRATSLGGVESLVEPTLDNHWQLVPGPLDLVRLSMGIEAPVDLVAGLEQALDGY